EVRLLVVAPRRDFACRALDDDAAVGLGEFRDPVDGHTVVDDGFDRVDVRYGKVVAVELPRSDDAFPRTRAVPRECSVRDLVRLAVPVDHEAGGLARFLGPVLDRLLRSSRAHL